MDEKQRHKEIEQYLKQEKASYNEYMKQPKYYSALIRLILLGSSDSGKSTLLKQLKILHGGGFTTEEVGIARVEILDNFFRDVAVIIRNDETPEYQAVQVFD